MIDELNKKTQDSEFTLNNRFEIKIYIQKNLAISFLLGFYMSIMNSVSFKAKLIVDDSLYKKMPVGTPENYTDELVAGYKKFLDHRVIKAVTEGDTVELYKDKYNQGFALGIRYTSDKLEKPIESGIYTREKIPNVSVGSLMQDTMVFLIIKSGIKPRLAESTQKAFIRALETMLKERKTNS